MSDRQPAADCEAALEAARQTWPLLAEALRPRSELLAMWRTQALAAAGVDDDAAARRVTRLRRWASALLNLAGDRLARDQRLLLERIVAGSDLDLDDALERRLAALADEREDAYAAARSVWAQLRHDVDNTSVDSVARGLARLREAAAENPVPATDPATVGVGVLAAVGVRLRNAERLLAGIGHVLGSPEQADTEESSGQDAP